MRITLFWGDLLRFLNKQANYTQNILFISFNKSMEIIQSGQNKAIITKVLPNSYKAFTGGNLIGNSKLECSPKEDGFVRNADIKASSVAKSIIPLNRESLYSNFFGVTSAENIQNKLDNQMALTWLKSEEQNISNFTGISTDSPNYRNREDINRSLEELYKNGISRLTMRGSVFGGKDATHTIGLVFDKNSNTMYVLDSLPEEVSSTYRETLLRVLDRDTETGNIPKHKQYNGKHIQYVFSGKPQQQMNEYSCNNWTHANIEAVQNAIKNGKVLNEEELDEVLPSDINEILKSQMNYLTKDNEQAYADFLKMFNML